MPHATVDGQDVRAAHEATVEAVALARRGDVQDGPTLTEARTYRFDEHNVGLIVPGEPYRPLTEIEQYRQRRDPLVLFRAVLKEQTAGEEALQELEREVAKEVEEAVVFARAAPLPELAALYENLYSNPIIERLIKNAMLRTKKGAAPIAPHSPAVWVAMRLFCANS